MIVIRIQCLHRDAILNIVFVQIRCYYRVTRDRTWDFFKCQLKTTTLNSHINSKRQYENICRTTAYIWPPHTTCSNQWVIWENQWKSSCLICWIVYQKITYVYYIYLPMCLDNAMPVLEFNDTFMSDWNKIQYHIHDFFISTNFNNFSKKSMMFHAIETDLNFNDF